MTRRISQRELRNESGEVMRALDRGEEFIVTRNNVPIGELIPLRRPGFAPTSQLIEAVRGTGPIDRARFRRDLDDLFDDEFEPRA